MHNRPNRHREAAHAAVAIQGNISDVALDCFRLGFTRRRNDDEAGIGGGWLVRPPWLALAMHHGTPNIDHAIRVDVAPGHGEIPVSGIRIVMVKGCILVVM